MNPDDYKPRVQPKHVQMRGELEVKMRDFEVHPRAWEPDEKPMHWRGTWTRGEEDDTFTITGDSWRP